VARTDLPDAFDLAVVGGGINGAGIARDAAGRGLSVGLLEQDDLASHTSSASTKLIHGGLRYLEHGELRLVRESLAERERLLQIAPHIVRPLRFVLPWVEGLRPRWLLRLGLFVYDHAGGREQLAASQALQLAGTPLGAPLRPELRTGFEYSDCQVEDSRLVVLNALDAAERGAAVHVRTRLDSATAGPAGWDLRCGDRTLRARVLVNAAGAWVNDVLGRVGVEPRQHLRLVKGSHLVLRRLYAGEQAYLLQGADRRVVFAIPWEQQYTLVGTTDVPFEGDPARVGISVQERDYLLACLGRFFRDPVGPADIRGTFAGVRPLFDDGSGRGAASVSRDYHLELQRHDTGAPVLSVYGGKITTYRRLAEHALSMLEALPGIGTRLAGKECWTGGKPLPGGDFAALEPNGTDPVAGQSTDALAAFTARARARWPGLPPTLVARLARTYGTRLVRILGDASSVDDLGGCLVADLTRAELRYLVEAEWARCAEDVLWRRTWLGIGAPASAVDHLQDAVAKLL
jgi:glycerol-3-phosphate dehydrogenase